MSKGRSSSKVINLELQRSLGTYLGAGLRPGFGYLRTHLNPSEDSTRGVPLRKPAKPCAPPRLSLSGLDLNRLKGLPDPMPCLPCQPLPAKTLKALKSIPAAQFVLHASFTDLDSALTWGSGWLDLFSGSRG